MAENIPFLKEDAARGHLDVSFMRFSVEDSAKTCLDPDPW